MNNQLVKNETKRTLTELIQSDKVKQQISMALPKHLTADRMTRVACTTIMRVPKLAQCTPESLLNCLMQCSQLGLEPDGRRAHLIPFENRAKGTVECTLILDWKGLAELALRGGTIAKLHADLICDKDAFEFDMGDILHHKINFREPRGEPYAAYAMAVTKTGEKFVQVMTKEEIEKIRDNSQGWKSFKAGYAKQSPWQDSPGEMWKKTAFRRLSKWLPLSPEYRDALEQDDEIAPPSVSAEQALPTFGALPEPETTGQPEQKAEEQPKKRGKKEPVDVTPTAESKPEAAPTTTTPEPQSFEQIVDGQDAQNETLSKLRTALALADCSEGQAVAFYNANRGPEKAEIKTLAEMPADSQQRLLPMLEKKDGATVKMMKQITL